MIASSGLFRVCCGWFVMFTVLIRPSSLQSCVNSNIKKTCDNFPELFPNKCQDQGGYVGFDNRPQLRVEANTCNVIIEGQQSRLNYSLSKVEMQGHYDSDEYMLLKIDFICLNVLNETVYKQGIREIQDPLTPFNCASNGEEFESVLSTSNIKCYVKSCAAIRSNYCNLKWFSPIPIECNIIVSPDVVLNNTNTSMESQLPTTTNVVLPSDVVQNRWLNTGCCRGTSATSSVQPSPGILSDIVTTMPGDPTIQPSTSSSSPNFPHSQPSTISSVTTASTNSDYSTTSSSESSLVTPNITSSPIELRSTENPTSSRAITMINNTTRTSSIHTSISNSSISTAIPDTSSNAFSTSNIYTSSTETTSIPSASGSPALTNNISQFYLMLSITIPLVVLIVILCIPILACFIMNTCMGKKYGNFNKMSPHDRISEEKSYQTINLDLIRKSNDTLLSLPSVVTLVQELQYSSLMDINNENCLYLLEKASKLQSAGSTLAIVTASNQTSMHLPAPLAISKGKPMAIPMSTSLPYLGKGGYVEDDSSLCEITDTYIGQQSGTPVSQHTRVCDDLPATEHQSAIITPAHDDCDMHCGSYSSGEYNSMIKDAEGYIEMQHKTEYYSSHHEQVY